MTQTKKVGTDLTAGNILYQLILFVLPLLLTNFVQQLYNTADMVIVGRFVGSAAANGVSNGGEIASLVTFLATSFGSAGQIYVSQLYGARDHKGVSETLSTAMILMVGMSLAAMTGCLVFCDQMLTWLNCPEEAFTYARDYMRIVSLGLPAVFGYNMICSILRGMGESKRPLRFVSIAAVANIVMDLLLVAWIPMESAGSAIATIIAQYASFAAAAWFLYQKREAFELKFQKNAIHIYRVRLRALAELGIPMAAQSFLIHFSLLICAGFVNNFGLVASTANSIGNRVTRLVNIFSTSVNQGTDAMVGQNIGAKKYGRVKKIVYTALASSVGCAVIASGFALLMPKQIYSLFLKSTDPNFEAILDMGVICLRYHVIVFLFDAIQGAYQSVVTGSGNAKLGMIAGLLDGVFLRLGFTFLLAYTFGMGIEGFFLANGLARLGPITVGVAYFYSGKWKDFNFLEKIDHSQESKKQEGPL